MKFYGTIGFSQTVDDGDGNWKETIIEKKYCGDVLQYTRRVENGEHINDGLRINTRISVLCHDPWFHSNVSQIRYAEYMGSKWTVESIDPSVYPSIIITLGGLYNGDEPEKETESSASENIGADSGE